MLRSLACLIFASVKTTILPSNPTDRLLGLVVVIMFLAGVALVYCEVVRWWKARMERCEPPPLSKLIVYVFDSDRRWHPTKVLWFRVPHIRAIPERLQSSVQRVQENRPTEVSGQEAASGCELSITE